MGKFFVSIFMVLFLGACSDSNDSSIANVGSNGLPVSMSVFPDINIIRGADGKDPKIENIFLIADVDYNTSAALQKNIMFHGFKEVASINDDNGTAYLYAKDNASCIVFRYNLNGTMVSGAELFVAESEDGVDITKVYTYFQPVLNAVTYISFAYDYFDVATLNTFNSQVESRGFTMDIQNGYKLNDYTYDFLSDDMYGYRLTFMFKNPMIFGSVRK